MKIKVWLGLCICLIDCWCGGWFYTTDAAESALIKAQKNPLSKHVVSVFDGEGNHALQGTGVVMTDTFIATADHVLRHYVDHLPHDNRGPFQCFSLGESTPLYIRAGFAPPDLSAHKGDRYSVKQIYALPKCDMMFLKVDGSEDSLLSPAPLVTKDEHDEIIDLFVKPQHNLPRYEFLPEDHQHAPLTYLGFGSYGISSEHDCTKLSLTNSIQTGRHVKNDGLLRQGGFHLSQHFAHQFTQKGDIFYGYGNLKQDLYNIPLSGDSGGPCFTEAGTLFGIVSTIHVPDFFPNESIMSTGIIPFFTHMPKDIDKPVWEALLDII